MARICLVSQSLSPSLLQTALSLSDKNQVTLLTSRNEVPPVDFPLPVMTYFKNWSWFEAIKLFPLLLQQEIIHFFFHSPSDTPNWAQVWMATTLHSFPKKMVATSFWYPLSEINSFWLSPFVHQCDLLTTDSRSSLNYAKRILRLRERTTAQVFLPTPSMASKVAHVNEQLALLTHTLRNYWLVPHWQSDLKSPLTHFPVVTLSPRQYYLENVFHLENADDVQIDYLIKNAKGLVLANYNYTAFELKKFQKMAFSHHTPLVVRGDQLEAVPGLVKAKATGWVVPHSDWGSIAQLLNGKTTLNMDKTESAWNISDWEPLNQLSRLYERAAHAK